MVGLLGNLGHTVLPQVPNMPEQPPLPSRPWLCPHHHCLEPWWPWPALGMSPVPPPRFAQDSSDTEGKHGLWRAHTRFPQDIFSAAPKPVSPRLLQPCI